MVVGLEIVGLGAESLPQGPLPSRLLWLMHNPRRQSPPTTARLNGCKRKDANPQADRVSDGGSSPLGSLLGYGIGGLSRDWRWRDAWRKCDCVCVTTSSLVAVSILRGAQLKDRVAVISSFLGAVRRGLHVRKHSHMANSAISDSAVLRVALQVRPRERELSPGNPRLAVIPRLDSLHQMRWARSSAIRACRLQFCIG